MKRIFASSTDYLACLSTVTLGCGVGFLTLCLVHLVSYRDAQAKLAWDLGTNTLIAGLVLGVGACKASQVRREWIERR